MTTGPAPGDATRAVREAAEAWDRAQGTRRLFARDASLWTGADEASWLAWLDLDAARAAVAPAHELADRAASARLTDVALLGMGGSSLCPEVLARVLGTRAGGLRLHVLDSIDPARVEAVLGAVNPAATLMVVASKSGSTLEPNLLKSIVLERIVAAVGADRARERCVAITDPGSSLEREAREAGWTIVPGDPGIGGRYSALSPFGIVPAVLLGLDVEAMLDRAQAMRDRCATEPAASNPGVSLGVAIGALARLGRDKLSILASPRLAPCGAWIEQLVAESSGKGGAGILPVEGEPEDAVRNSGADRAFVVLGLTGDPGALEALTARLPATAGPITRCDLATTDDLFAAFYRWEIATAVACSILGLHAFNQPDVEAAKIAARRRMEVAPSAAPAQDRQVLARASGVAIEAARDHARALAARLPAAPTLADVLRAHLGDLQPPDSLAILAWRDSNASLFECLRAIRREVGRTRGIATTLGTGPRFLHSTGQLHKGGPATGAYLQVMGPSAGAIEAAWAASLDRALMAQAEGDFDVLAERGRRALLVRLADTGEAPRALVAAVREALATA